MFTLSGCDKYSGQMRQVAPAGRCDKHCLPSLHPPWRRRIMQYKKTGPMVKSGPAVRSYAFINISLGFAHGCYKFYQQQTPG